MDTYTDTCDATDCQNHYHLQDPIFVDEGARQESQARLVEQQSTSSKGLVPDKSTNPEQVFVAAEQKQDVVQNYDPDDRGFRRIIRNFTPSYVCHCLMGDMPVG